jgi:MoxR-like ATPase
MSTTGDLQLLDRVKSAREALFTELQRRIVGQSRTLELVMVSLLAGGHTLVIGVPGLAKTLLVHTLGQALSLATSRVQFTPDLMPSDITGTEVLQEDRAAGKRVFTFVKGPIFANLVLADEVNRTPPKTQAALLEAMQEGQVTAGGKTWELPRPFLVLATQNPIEAEGTYPLPEAQLDRFLLSIHMDYPSAEDEVRIAALTSAPFAEPITGVLNAEELRSLQDLVLRVPAAEHVIRYAVALTRATRPGEDADRKVRDYVLWGAGPRGAQHLMLAAKSWALLCGRPAPNVEDVRALAAPVLQHRMVMTFRAESEGVAPADLIRHLVSEVPVPVSGA